MITWQRLGCMSQTGLYFISVNTPDAQVSHEEELRGIEDSLGPIAHSPLARFNDIVNGIVRTRAEVIHFCTHGIGLNSIVLLEDDGSRRPLNRVALTKLMERHRDQVRLVVFNVCHSFEQATEISKHIDCVIGVRENIPADAAKEYAVQFYKSLAGKRSIAEAHEDADTLLLRRRKLTEAQRPELIARPGVDPKRITLESLIQASESLQEFRNRKKAFYNHNATRCKVSAKSLSLTIHCNEDGSSDLEYEIEGLAVEEGDVESLAFALESEAGRVNAPVRDERAKALGIRWVPAEVSPPQSLEDVIKQVSIARGQFSFDERLNQHNGPYTFGWSMHVSNMDARTAWEFRNLYATEDRRRNVNGNQLDGPWEYFARLAWLPSQQMKLRLVRTTPWAGPPQFRYFELEGRPEIPPDAILRQGKLYLSYPRDLTLNNKAKWQANRKEEALESTSLRASDDRLCYELIVDYPLQGSYYSVEWELKDPPMSRGMKRMVRETRTMRMELLAHRNRRLEPKKGALSGSLSELFKELHHSLYQRLRSEAPNEKFETALMTYDESSCRLVVVEACLNNEETVQTVWTLALPFGLGLGGECFRMAAGAFRYERSIDKRDPLEPASYLSRPDGDAHEFVIALPIDHPNLHEAMDPNSVHRSRQLLGVLTLSSTVGTSKLFDYCESPETEEEKVEIEKRLADLRKECQLGCDRISALLLGRTVPFRAKGAS